jgi:RHS repeat-associated protein
LSYGYDWNNNPTGWTESYYPDHTVGAAITNNALNAPASVTFHPNSNENIQVVSSVSYGPNKMPTSIQFGNGTANSATYNNAGMPTYVALARGGTTLYDAGYEYDGAGNILSITSAAPALTATFGYDPLNRLTSAAYSSGSPSTYSYQYDKYGNMLNATGGIGFPHTYNNKNQIPQSEGFFYDSRGNLLTSGGNIYYWDAQNRLQYIQNTSGAVIGKYLYDDRGLRLMAVPPLPEINVRHEAVDISDEGEAFLRGPVGQIATETLTIQNLGDANLNISSVDIPNDPENNFDFSTPTSPILPNGSANFEIQFHPQTNGPKTATLTITCNDPDEGTYEIILFGNYEPEISIPQAPDGGTFDYGEITIGDFWQQTFTIHNSGDKNLVLYGNPIVVIDGADADQFEVISQPNNILDPLPLHIEPYLSRTFVIRFSPNSEGLKTASISIANNDWDENPYDITLEGTGVLGTDKIDDNTAFVVTSPVEGEEIVPGSVHLITWTGAPEVKEVRIDFSIENGSTYKTIIERTENTGSYPWLVPPVVSGLCLVRVSSADGTSAEAEMLSVEFKVKMTSGGTGASGLTLRTSLPDPKTPGSWSAEIVFAPDEVRKVMALNLNSAGTDTGLAASFYGKWHTVRLVLDYAACSGSLWLDGQPVLHLVPLVQGAWLGESPFVELRTAGGSDVRVEDFEARFKDRTLKPEIEGQEVSQLLVKDSFEGYAEGRFPSQGGWRLNGGTEGIVEQPLPGSRKSPTNRQDGLTKDGQKRQTGDQARSEKAEDAGLREAQERTTQGSLLRKRGTCVDSGDSVTGLRSLQLMCDVPVELILAKLFDLPTAAPFGVSEGNFTIGAVPETGTERALSRSRAVDRLLWEEEGKRTRMNDDSVLANKKRSSEEVDGTVKTARARSASLPNGKSTKLMSAAPVGNFYIYSFDGKLLQVYDVYRTLLKDFVYMGNQLVAEYDYVNARLLYYTPDQINSTRVVTDGVGNVVYTATYDPYGNVRTETGSINPMLKFSGKERDAESQLDYFGARYYDHTSYRFISVDPVIPVQAAFYDPQSWNLYGFCRSNPVSQLDPDGRQAIEIWRYRYGTDATYGTYMVHLGENVITGFTLEPARGVGKGPIPALDYDAKEYWWQKKGYQVFWLQDVPGFTEIFLHAGVDAGNTSGCVLLGKSPFPGGGGRGAVDELNDRIANYKADKIEEAIGDEGGLFFDLDFLNALLRTRVVIRDVPLGTVTYTWELTRIR